MSYQNYRWQVLYVKHNRINKPVVLPGYWLEMHTILATQNLTAECPKDSAEMAGIELVFLDKDTNFHNLKNELKWEKVAYQFNK